ncbi:MAG: patatin-like phospholipase family protein, partial [Myxococcales bacterium]|nr:patatin-like phospholipase family protein [Myxococcales bacterium]
EAVDELGEGGLVGDVGLLSGEPHEALVIAVRDTEVARLAAADVWAMVREHPELAEVLGRGAVQLLRAAFRPPLRPDLVNVAVVPIDQGAPLRTFASALADALGAGSSLRYVHAELFDAEIGEGASTDDVDAWDQTDRRIVRWVTEQERRYRFIVYEADRTWTAWTRRCVRMADKVLLVARADTVAEVTDTERHLQAVAAVGQELVLMHPDDAERPRRTSVWLDRRPHLRRVHHVRLADPTTVARLARFLTNRSVGLVLGGGGARGTAQMGAIQALRDVGVPIDLVGGTSAGGGVAAMAALGWDLETMRARNHRAFVVMAPFQQYTLPFYSLIQKHRVEQVSRWLYGDARIEDLWLPMFCVACDLVRGEKVVLRDGELWRAILATTALPGVVPPVWFDGRLLVDGGVMDNNPVRTMREMHPGPTLLVDVGQARAELVSPPDLRDLPSPLTALWHRFKPFGPRVKVPTIPEIVARTMTVARPNDDPSRLCDLYVRPAVDPYGLTDFKKADQLVAIGYNATMDALAAKADDHALLDSLSLSRHALKDLPRLPVPGT